MERGHVGVSRHHLRVAPQRVVIKPVEDPRQPVAAADHEDAADRRIADRPVEFGGPLVVGAGEVAVPATRDCGVEVDAKARLLQRRRECGDVGFLGNAAGGDEGHGIALHQFARGEPGDVVGCEDLRRHDRSGHSEDGTAVKYGKRPIGRKRCRRAGDVGERKHAHGEKVSECPCRNAMKNAKMAAFIGRTARLPSSGHL